MSGATKTRDSGSTGTHSWVLAFGTTGFQVQGFYVIGLLLFIARGKKQIISLIAITLKPGTQDPIVPNT